MNYWLIKSDPETYSWQDLVKEGETSWDGVRSYAARNHLKGMKKGDQVLVYHSGGESMVTGLAVVSKEFYQDPTTDEDAWVSVRLKSNKPLPKPVKLSVIKADKRLKKIPLVTIGRLSVMPLGRDEFEAILSLGNV